MNPVVIDTMNDILNKVETREWNRVNEHRDRLVKKMKKQNEKIQYWKNATGEAEDNLDEQMKVNEEMSENWEVATEKIGQENSDLHNEIKRLKDEIKENEKLKKENEELMAVIEKMDMRIIELRKIEKDITLHRDYDKLIELEESH